MTKIFFALCITLLSSASSVFSQTKTELVEQIKLIDREKEEGAWIKTELTGTILFRSFRMSLLNTTWTKECSFDLKKVESVILRYDKDYSSWYPVVLFKGFDNYETEVDDDGSRRSLVPQNERLYYFFKDKVEAVKAQNLFIKLAQLCGAKLIIKK